MLLAAAILGGTKMVLVRPNDYRTRLVRVALLGYALVALVFTALGPLPWVLLPSSAVHEHHHHAGAGAQTHHHGGLDASDIPGSPLHPDDHGCAACTLFAHLSRVGPGSSPAPLLLAVHVVTFTLQQPDAPPVRISGCTALPRVRGPPTQLA